MNMPHRLKHVQAPRTGFTLVELLVVVAVVGVLVGLLMPALGSARRASMSVACASNLRQLVIANDAYASDHDNRYAPGAPGIAGANRVRWHGSRATASDAFRPEGGTLSAYLAEDGATSVALRQCPAWKPVHAEPSTTNAGASAAASAGFERSAGGYGYNNAFVGTQRRERVVFGQSVWEVESDRVGARRSAFRRAGTTVAFADTALAAEELIEYSFVEPAFWPEFPGSRPDPSAHFRHGGALTGSGGRANVAWLDGHVSGETLAHSESSGVYPLNPADFRVGWFGDVSSNHDFQP
ncbi:MAG: prepilin-type N-terminal cleavage/methylation domain-containing protein [Phycisphaerales bacterium]